MAEEIFASVQVRRDNKANWEAVNPILLDGEAAYEKDTDMFKIGDGVKRYSDLPYHNKVGPQGPQGEPGPTPQISMNVSTGSPGTSASVSVTGTAENPVINLTVPRGDTGKTGSIGPKGDTGSSGVYIGTSQPTDSNINVWIDSDGEPTEVIDDFAREEISSLKDDISALNQAKVNNADLAKVAKSGSYDDLTNKPTIPTVPSALPNPNALTFTGAVTGSYDGSAPMSVEIPSGGGGSSGGSGKAKSQILIDQEITELTASLSVTLEHDFHNLTAIINCGSAGAALTADSGGAADASSICLLINTTSFGYNSLKVSQTDTSTEMWKSVMFGAEWSDDLSVFKRGFVAEIATGKKQTYSSMFGGTSAMYGTLGTDDNAPRTGKTANIVVNGAYLNVGTRVVLWGEYYE